jgi:flagellar biosynthetic protein FliP
MTGRQKKHLGIYWLVALSLLLSMFSCISDAGAAPLSFPNIALSIGSGTGATDKVSVGLQLLLVLTVITLAPAILLLLTSFTRIVVVLSLLRHALGTQQMPPNQIIIGLSLFLTIFIMMPVGQAVNKDALTPYYDEQISGEEALNLAAAPIKAFMLKQTREKDLALFLKISKEKRPEKADDISLSVVIPAFVISELKTAFQIGFLLYLPFFIIDMVVSSILLSMGMMMLPPVMMSLPFKLLLFVLVDGWNLIVSSLVQSFH